MDISRGAIRNASFSMDHDAQANLLQQIENQNKVIENKETNILNLQKHNTDLEQKLQKLLMEFT